jgi:predicted PurR-regulated permease PerM
MALFVLAANFGYNGATNLVETIPQYSQRIRHFVSPLEKEINKVQQTAGSLSSEPPPTRKVPEVTLRQPPTWPSFVLRGVGSVWGALIIIAVVPFLMYFNLIRKEQMHHRLISLLGGVIDVPQFIRAVSRMVRGFTVGNLVVGSGMAVVTVVVLLALRVEGAIILGVASGFLNLIPFIGVLLALIVTMGAALLQFDTLGPFAIIFSVIVCLHVISANFIIPKVIGSRVNIGPVAAMLGILFWGWLWGGMGILLAVPLTAFVKIVADCHPSLAQISNLLSESPKPISHWKRVAQKVEAEQLVPSTNNLQIK